MKATTALLPFLAGSATAASNSVICRTYLGGKSIKHVPTVTVTSTNSHRPTVTKSVVPTLTKSVAHWYTYTDFTTETIFETETAVTDTYSTTTTEFAVRTLTDTSTITVTSTTTQTTSSVSTTVIPTNDGFRNVQDTLNSHTIRKRDTGSPHAHVPRKVANKGLAASNYAARVDCTRVVPNTNTKTVFKTLPVVTKTVAYWKSTTETDTISSTSTVIPVDVSTTLTSTSTSSVTTTTTAIATNVNWATTTTTSVLPGPTIYNACNERNQYGPVFSHSGVSYFFSNALNNGARLGGNYQMVADGAGSWQECCVSCQQLGTCETFLYRGYSRNCILMSHDSSTCKGQMYHPNMMMCTLNDPGSNPDTGYVIGNGNCGFAFSTNSDGTVFSVDNLS